MVALLRRAELPSRQAGLALVGVNLLVVLAVYRSLAGVLLAAAILAPVAWAILQRPQRGVLLLIAVMPFHGLLLLVPHPSVIDGWKEALTIATLVATFLCPQSTRGRPARQRPSWLPALILLAAVGVASAMLLQSFSALYGLKVYFFAPLGAWAIWRCPLAARERDRAITILMTCGVVVAAYGVAQQLIGPAGLNALGYEYNSAIRLNGSFLRSFSTFEETFGYAYYLMLVLLLCLPVALTDPHRWRNRAFLLALPLLGLGLGCSFVRGAWLGFAVGFVFLASSHFKALLLALPIALVALLFLPADAASSAFSSSSTAQRTANWSENVHQFVVHPFGAGIGSAGAAAAKSGQLTSGPAAYYEPDNYYFLITYELGPLGTWFHLLLLVGLFTAMRSAARSRAGPDSALASGIAALVLALAASSAIASVFEIYPITQYLWIAVGIVATVTATSTATASDPEHAGARPAIAR